MELSLTGLPAVAVGKGRLAAYWAATALLVMGLASGGFGDIAHWPGVVEGMTHLGYPSYFMTIIGVWKLLGCAALLAPKLPLLKEWAYAGIVIEMTGASFSHLACGDQVWHVATPLLFVALAIASWALRPASRRLA